MVKRILGRWQPLRERLPEDDRLRMLSGAIGLGVLAYEGVPTRSKLPLSLVGTQALRIGLHRQLKAVHQQTGYTIAPSIGRRRFEVTVRKTF